MLRRWPHRAFSMNVPARADSPPCTRSASCTSTKRSLSERFSSRSADSCSCIRSSRSCASCSRAVAVSRMLRSLAASALTDLNQSSISAIRLTSVAIRRIASASCSRPVSSITVTPSSSSFGSGCCAIFFDANAAYVAIRSGVCSVRCVLPDACGLSDIWPIASSKFASSVSTSRSMLPASTARCLEMRSSTLPYSVVYRWSGCSSPSEWTSLSFFSVRSMRRRPSESGWLRVR
mmetsp:Transcript_88688/g.266807  ORF Transcript_88688/g.266807 Transcript_88688/m.266807 type:complete len:234 (-) Transcript_88688:292-993(-)